MLICKPCIQSRRWVVIIVDFLIAEAHKVMVEEHLYQNVQIRSRTKSADGKSNGAQSPKPTDKQRSSVPPQTPPPPIGPKPGTERPPPVGPKPGVAEYSVVSHDWIEKKKTGAQKANNIKTSTSSTSSDSAMVEAGSPPALPPRSELANQFDDDDLYDLPIIHEDIKIGLPSDRTTSSSSVAMNNALYESADSSKPANSVSTAAESADITYDVIADVKKSPEKKKKRADVTLNATGKKLPVERKTPNSSPMITKKMITLPKAASVDATYDVVADAPSGSGKSLTMPAANRRSPSPEYAVIRQSPVLPRAPLKSPAKPDSPALSRAAVGSTSEYDYISHTARKESKTEEEQKESEYDLPVTARQAELRINSPPSPMLSNYAKLQSKDERDKQEWQLPKQATGFKKKTSKSMSIDVAETSGAANSVEKTIEELKKGLNNDSDHTKHRAQSMDLSTVTSTGELDWDDSDMPAEVSAIQQAWMEKHHQNLIMRSYEQVQLPLEANSSHCQISLPEKLRHGWSPKDDSGTNEKLPPGWNKVIGEDGVYYWHVKSGKTQWTLPTEGVNTDKVILACFDLSVYL